MVILELYSKSIKTKYKNYLCSKATIFILITTSINIIFPFIFCYNSRGFWLKHDVFYEQPDVRFRGEYLFIGYTENISFPIVCNNFPYYHNRNNQDSCTMIKVREIDKNYDGKIDELKFKLILTLPKTTNIISLDLIIPIDYRLHTICPLNMQAIVLIQEMLNNFANMISITSVLRLSQKFPLPCHSEFKNIVYNESVIKDSENLENYKLKTIIREHNERNVTTYLSDIYKMYEIQQLEKFELNVNIIYPEHKIYYETGFWQIIKWAWIQYLSIYIILRWFIKKIKDYIFENHLVLFYRVSPIKYNL